MNAPWLIAIVSALSGGVVGGVVAGKLVAPTLDARPDRPVVSDEAPMERKSADSTSAPGGGDPRIGRLEHRVALLTAALARKGKGGAVAGDDSTDSPSDEGEVAATDVADPVFEAAVLDIMDRERERKEVEQTKWRKELHVERGRRFASELTESLTLDEQQQTEIAQAVADYFDSWRALRDASSKDRPATRKEWREQAENMNRAADTRLQAILKPEQYQKYQALEPEQQLGWGGRGRRAAPPVTH